MTLRRVRGWLDPWTFLGRCWRAWSNAPPPPELQALLDSSADLGEAVFHAFFESRMHLRALIGPYNSALKSCDRLAWQYPIFGDFRCDFAIGDWTRKAYTFVE